MSLAKNYLFFILFLSNYTLSFAQLGPHASTINWQQINTPKVRVLFPEGFEQQGLRVANMVNYLEQNNKRSIGDRSQKINIILHNQTVIPNGFVGTAPFRSEFFGTPPQSANLLGTLDWLDALTIHEYRHALQFSNAKVGATKIGYYLQGDNGWALMASLAVPSWFWEGDATVFETALSEGGRGRAPFFTLQQRATLLNGRDYNYMKARNGSFKDIVPNRYRLGYQMITHAQAKFGNDVWAKVFENAARYKYIVYPFSRALHKSIGLKTKQLYQKTNQTIKEKWQAQIDDLYLSPVVKIPTKKIKTVTNYRFPFLQKDSSIIVLKSSYQKTDALIRLKNGKEKVLTNIGFNIEKYLSVTQNKAIWTEYERDPRRSKKNYSNIVYYDLKTKKKTRLTSEERYFTPDFSNSEGRIVTVKITHEQENNLVVLNAKNGKLLSIIPNPDNHFLSFPKWADNDTDIVYIAKQNSQLAIFKYNMIDHSTIQLMDWTHHIIADLFVKNQTVYFTSSISGIDNIYKTSLTGNKRIEQISSVKIGAFYPSISKDGNTLIFSEYTDMGYHLSSLGITRSNNRNRGIQIIEPSQQSFYPINTISEEGGSILNKIPTEDYEIKDYKGLFKGIKLHSWNLYPSVSEPTLDVQLDNMLADFSINLQGGYNLNENTPVYRASATYSKWYPSLTAFTSFIKRGTQYLTPQDTIGTQTYNQTSLGGRISIPLNWAKDNHSTSFSPYIAYAQRFINDAVFAEQGIDDYSLGTIHVGFRVARLRRTAFQNLGPRGGQSFSFNYQQTVDDQTDKKIDLSSKLYFPGIGPNDNLRIGFAYQRQLEKNRYQFVDNFEYPRGYLGIFNDEFLKLSGDYQLPLLYPDYGLWGLGYLKRVSLNVFFDYGIGKLEHLDNTSKYKSVGGEVIFDTQVFNELPITFGLRNSLLLEDKVRYDFSFFVRSFIEE